MTQAQDVVPIEPDKPTVPLLPQPKFDLEDTVYFVYEDEVEVECERCRGVGFWTTSSPHKALRLGDYSRIKCPFCLGKQKVTEKRWLTGVASIEDRMATDGWDHEDPYCGGHGSRVQKVDYHLRHPQHGATTHYHNHNLPYMIVETEIFATLDEAETEAAARNEKGA